MREEEIKAVEHLNSFLNIPEFVWIKESELLMINVKIALNLIEKQQKEIEHWKAGMKIVERDKNNHIERLEKMIDKMADEILELNTMIVEKGELFSVVPMWLGKEHIIEYFKGITNKKD